MENRQVVGPNGVKPVGKFKLWRLMVAITYVIAALIVVGSAVAASQAQSPGMQVFSVAEGY